MIYNYCFLLNNERKSLVLICNLDEKFKKKNFSCHTVAC